MCCDANLVSPLTRTGQPQPGTAAHDGAMLRGAERKRAAYPELSSGSPQRLLVLGSEIGERWNDGSSETWCATQQVFAFTVPSSILLGLRV